MKQIYILLFSIVTVFTTQAQTDVYLKINHLLNGQTFAFNTSATNNLGNQFKVKRLQYYVSQVNIIHDGGQVTPATTEYFLIDASSTLNSLLGNLNITTIEGIQLGIGVEDPANHSDPASYNLGHPLYPQSPSMHWGWASGYRFVAMEGTSGNGFSQVFEIHALGDVNYHMFTINTAGTTSGNDLIIELDANMDMAIKNIDVSSGLVEHSESGDAANLLLNFNAEVFMSSDGNGPIGIFENTNLNEFVLFPNPSNGRIEIKTTGQDLAGFSLDVKDITGKTIEVENSVIGQNRVLNFDKSGIYFISIYSDNIYVGTKKVVVTH